MAIRGFGAQYVDHARKPYICGSCGGVIHIGQAYKYRYQETMYGREKQTYHFGALLGGTVESECHKAK